MRPIYGRGMGGERVAVAGWDLEACLAVVAGDLRKGAAGGRHQRYAARHGLDGRQGESLVERWNAGQFGLAIQLHYSFVGHPVHVGHAVGEPQVLEHLRRSTVLLRLSDDDEFDMAFGT